MYTTLKRPTTGILFSIILIFCLSTVSSLTAAAPRLRPLDFNQSVSPNSDGQVEGKMELFFNWGLFRSGLIYKSESITENVTNGTQDTFFTQNSKTYNLILLKTKTGFIGSKSFSFNPFIGVKFIDRTEKRIGENLATTNQYWFTGNDRDQFYNVYGSLDIVIKSETMDILLNAGGGYIQKLTSGDFRNSSDNNTLTYTSSDYGFNFIGKVDLMLKFFGGVHVQLTGSYNREASYYERYFSNGIKGNYAYYIHEFSVGIHLHLIKLKKILNGVPYIGITYVDYTREILTGTKEILKDSRFKFDIGVKL